MNAREFLRRMEARDNFGDTKPPNTDPYGVNKLSPELKTVADLVDRGIPISRRPGAKKITIKLCP